MSKLSLLCLTGYPSFAIILHMKNRILLAHSAQYEEDGSVKIPKALQPYMGGKEIIETKN